MIDWFFFFFFLLNLSGGLWQSWLREVPQFPERGWLRNSGWSWWCSLHPNVLVRKGLGLRTSWELSFPFPEKPSLCPLSCDRIGLVWSIGRLAYPDVSILNMGEITTLSLAPWCVWEDEHKETVFFILLAGFYLVFHPSLWKVLVANRSLFIFLQVASHRIITKWGDHYHCELLV